MPVNKATTSESEVRVFFHCGLGSNATKRVVKAMLEGVEFFVKTKTPKRDSLPVERGGIVF
jgi:hypothetical protein